MITLRSICPREHNMSLREVEVRGKGENPIYFWLLFGVCKECGSIITQGVHKDINPPKQGIDYIIKNEKIKETIKYPSKEIVKEGEDED